MVPRTLRHGQRAEVWIAEVDRESAELAYSTETLLLGAPNWAPDGGLLLNGDGLLWRLELEPEVALQRVPIEDLPPINNDHVLDAKHGLIYLSANDGHIYVAPVEGGTAKRITHDPSRYHFLHDVGPNATLAFVDIPQADLSVPGRLALISTAGGETHYPEAGSSHLDGPEYSPDGAWLYFNTEEFASRPGHAQLARMPSEGGPIERLVDSESVDWFPHLSPDGELANYISFPPGTLGHPADLDVEVRVIRTTNWRDIVWQFPLFGGQGTINVNSWSPDSRRFAFVAYPLEQA